jgi:hypothetical protein
VSADALFAHDMALPATTMHPHHVKERRKSIDRYHDQESTSAAATTTASSSASSSSTSWARMKKRARIAMQLEMKLYDCLARACAAHIATIYTRSPMHRNLERAALLFVASNVSAREVLILLRYVSVQLIKLHVCRCLHRFSFWPMSQRC